MGVLSVLWIPVALCLSTRVLATTVLTNTSLSIIAFPYILGFNSSPPTAAYMGRWTESALVQVMACRLSSPKPLPEPLLPYRQLDPCEQTSVKFESK